MFYNSLFFFWFTSKACKSSSGLEVKLQTYAPMKGKQILFAVPGKKKSCLLSCPHLLDSWKLTFGNICESTCCSAQLNSTDENNAWPLTYSPFFMLAGLLDNTMQQLLNSDKFPVSAIYGYLGSDFIKGKRTSEQVYTYDCTSASQVTKPKS